MKDIIKYIKNHIKEDFHLGIYLYAAVFLAITISINYHLDFEDKILDSYYGSWKAYLYYFIFYAFSYYAIAVPKLIVQKRTEVLKNNLFWYKSLIFITFIAVSASFYHFNKITTFFHNNFEVYYIVKILNNTKRFLVILIPFFVLKYIFDRYERGLYGLGKWDFNMKPYFTMLLIMFPLISLASFNDGFLQTYPTFKPWNLIEVFGMSKLQMTSLYEFVYGLDFITVELMFRGGLVIGMVAIMGKDAVLPMVVTYAFLHFGKPVGETIGSIFGGYILGVIALYSRNILGGCIIHMGVAYLMEFTAFIQHYYIKD